MTIKTQMATMALNIKWRQPKLKTNSELNKMAAMMIKNQNRE